MLTLKNINKDYITGELTVHALKNINLEFRQNEFVSVLGASGCGKTTLLNIIGGLDKYTSGDLIIKNKSTKFFKDIDWDTYRNHSVGFIFQSYNLIPHLSILGNVELALTLSGVSSEERKLRAKQALERVGLEKEISKRPNQLSGGQMQRVAIARALVNDPEILLADEPTGALDTQTSIQILNLIKEIANERLVIMVTHNAELAKKYSTRIINLKDGEVIGDTTPYDSQLEPKEIYKTEIDELSPNITADNNSSNSVKNTAKTPKHARLKDAKNKKSAMNFSTALSLSLKNLFSKKVRTLITSIAGSIGIVGIALVLSLSNGFTRYIDKMQSDTLSSYPLSIGTSSMDMTAMMNNAYTKLGLEKYPNDGKVAVDSIMKSMQDMMHQNTLTKEYFEYLKNVDKNLILDTQYLYSYKLENNIFFERQILGQTTYMSVATAMDIVKQGVQNNPMQAAMFNQMPTSFSEMPNNTDFIKSQYDVLYGKIPENKNEIAVVVDEYNKISDLTLYYLGYINELQLMNPKEDLNFSFEDICKKEYYLLGNDQIYQKDTANNKKFNIEPNIEPILNDKDAIIKVVGVIRTNKDTSMGALYNGFIYTKALTDYMLNLNINSEIINFLKTEENLTIDPLTGLPYTLPTGIENPQVEYAKLNANNINSLGGNKTPVQINLFPKDFKSKEKLKTYLDDFNINKEKPDQIRYTDVMGVVVTSMNTMIDAISYVLIAFTAISLLVSSVMIGIITYISVVERTKEIGVLRSIGARKKDISRVFNAETFLIGLSSGILGVIVAALLNIPINLIITSLVDGIGNLAVLNIFHAIVLVVVSVLLSMIAGLVPSRLAAKKDPVIALRNE